MIPWGSPDPSGVCNASVIPDAGEYRAAVLKVDYDIVNIDSKAGVRVPLASLDGKGFRKLVFRMKGHALSPSAFFVSLKAGQGDQEQSGMVFVENVGEEWQSVVIPLSKFKLKSLDPLTEVAIFFGGASKPKRGELYIQDIHLKK